MIQIKYIKTNAMHCLHIDGHADYNPSNDIVCAGVSAVTYTLAGWLLNRIAESDRHIKLDSGSGMIMCYTVEKADTAFDMAVIGFAQIANTYPNNVSFHISAGTAC
jgi:uncharacterized protein YsxB (DUF464 family)